METYEIKATCIHTDKTMYYAHSTNEWVTENDKKFIDDLPFEDNDEPLLYESMLNAYKDFKNIRNTKDYPDFEHCWLIYLLNKYTALQQFLTK
jgi:hypothetical protein